MAKFKIVDVVGNVVLNITLPNGKPTTKQVIAAFNKTVNIYTKKSHKVIPLHFVKDELIEAIQDSMLVGMLSPVRKLDGEQYFIGSEYL